MTAQKFRKKPVVIEAMQLTDSNAAEVAAWCGGKVRRDGVLYPEVAHRNVVDIVTLEGTMYADVGDWIIKGVAGEFYPCKPEIFEATYEGVSDGS